MLKSILRYGYTPSQIVSFLGRKHPELKSFIDQASDYGYDASNILQFMQRKGQAITGYDYDEKPVSDIPLVARFDHMRNRNSAGMKKLAKFLGAGAAIGAGLYAGAGLFGSTLSGGMDLFGGGDQPDQTPQGPRGTPPTPGSPAQEQEMNPDQDILQGMQEEERRVPDVLSEIGLVKHAESMIQAGNSPEVVAKYMQKHEMKTPEAKEVSRKYGDDLSRILTENAERIQESTEIAEKRPRPTAPSPPSDFSSPPIDDRKLIETPTPKEQKEREGFKKGDIVSTKSGETGQIVSSKPNHSVVEIDDKRRVIVNDDLSKVKEHPSEDIEVKLSEGFTPPSRKLKSAVVNGMTYNSKTKELVVKFNSGAVYLYEDVPMESYEKFSEGADTCSTSGENEFGCWYVGKNPTLGGSFVRRIKNAGFKHTRLK